MIKLQKILLFIGVFLFLYTPQFNIFDLFIIESYWIVLIALTLIEIYYYGISKKYSPLIALLLISFSYVLINTIINEIYDYLILKQIITAFLVLMTASFLIRKYATLYKYKYLDAIINDLSYSILINSLIILLTVYSNEFKEFIYQYIYITEKAERYLFGDVEVNRYPGVTVSGFTALSVMTAIIILFLMMFGIKYVETRDKRLLKIYAICLISTFSLIFVARTGLYISLIILLGFSLIYALKILQNKAFFLSVKISILCLCFYFAVGETNYLFTSFAFEIINNYFSGEGLRSVSTDNLIEKEFFFPINFTEFLIGNGNFGRGSEYISSDIGWVLFINFGGILGSIIIYLPLLYIGLGGFIYKKNKYFGLFLFFSMLILLICNFKDIFYLSHGYIQPIIFVYVLSIFQKFSPIKNSTL